MELVTMSSMCALRDLMSDVLWILVPRSGSLSLLQRRTASTNRMNYSSLGFRSSGLGSYVAG
jgi:hypothetical protein